MLVIDAVKEAAFSKAISIEAQFTQREELGHLAPPFTVDVFGFVFGDFASGDFHDYFLDIGPNAAHTKGKGVGHDFPIVKGAL